MNNLFFLHSVNTRVVRRSSLLLKDGGAPYGPDSFYYAETEIKKSFFSSVLHTFGLLVFVMFAYFSLGRSVLKKVLPSPGTGPSKEERDNSWFQIQFVGEAVNGKRFRGKVAGGDPGYTETAKMISNAALCLLETDKLLLPGGILTAASSMGDLLVEKLQNAGMTLVAEEIQ